MEHTGERNAKRGRPEDGLEGDGDREAKSARLQTPAAPAASGQPPSPLSRAIEASLGLLPPELALPAAQSLASDSLPQVNASDAQSAALGTAPVEPAAAVSSSTDPAKVEAPAGADELPASTGLDTESSGSAMAEDAAPAEAEGDQHAEANTAADGGGAAEAAAAWAGTGSAEYESWGPGFSFKEDPALLFDYSISPSDLQQTPPRAVPKNNFFKGTRA